MSKKYTNAMRLNLPTGEDCLRANAELQRRLLAETEEYAYKIWDRVGGRIISALIESTSETFKTTPDVNHAFFHVNFIKSNVFNWQRGVGRSEEEIRAIIEVWHMFKSLPSSIDQGLNEYYAELLMENLIADLETYGYEVNFGSEVRRYYPFFNPDEAGGRTYDYKMYITPMRNDFMSRFRRKMNKMYKAFLSKMNRWFPSHEVRKRA